MRIEQLIGNLVTNALRYGAPPIVVEGVGDVDVVEVRVIDHGTGIPIDERDQVFDSFYQGSARHVGTGSGLGLAICRAIAAAHGGSIDLEEGPGATFLVRIPQPVRVRPT